MSKNNVQNNFITEINNLKRDQQLFLAQIKEEDVKLRKTINFENYQSYAEREKLVSTQSKLFKESLLQSKKLVSEQLLKLDQLEIDYPNEKTYITSLRKSIFVDIKHKFKEEIFKDYAFIRQDKIVKLRNIQSITIREIYGTNDPYLIRDKRKKSQDQSNGLIKSTGLIGNIEVDSLVAKIERRHNQKKQGFAEGEFIGRQDFDKNSNIQDLKNDIYLLIELTNKANTEREYNFIDDNIEKYIKQYNQVAKPIAQNREIQKGGSAYNFIMNNSEDKIAMVMHDMSRKQNNQTTNLNLDTSILLRDAPPEFVKRIYSIQSKIEQKEKSNWLTVDDVLNRFINKIANIVGLGIKDKDIINLQNIIIRGCTSSKSTSSEVNIANLYRVDEIKKNLGKFINAPVEYDTSLSKELDLNQQLKQVSQVISNYNKSLPQTPNKKKLLSSPPNKPLPPTPVMGRK